MTVAALEPYACRPAGTLPPCPAWCRGDCVGGHVEHLGGGLTLATDRLHERALAEMVVADGDSSRDRQDVRLFIERLDSIESDAPAPTVTRVQLEVDRHGAARPVDVDELTRGVSDEVCRSIAAQTLAGATGPRRLALTAAELRHLAAAALEATHLLDAATVVPVAA